MNSTAQNISAHASNAGLIAACILNLTCCITGGIGNLLVLLSYYCYRKMRTVTNLYLCSLALVDLIVCVLVQPLYITTLLNQLRQSEQKYFFQASRKILTWCIMTIASGNLTAVMLDRYCRVSFPLKYRTMITKRRSYFVLIFFWLVGVLAGLMLIFKPDAKIIIQSYVIFLVNGVVIPGYIRVFFIARKLARKTAYQMKYLEQISQQHLPMKTNYLLRNTSENRSCKSSDYEAIKTIFIVIAAFIICWTPLLFFPFYYRWVSLKSRSNLVLRIFPIVNTLALCSSSINPFIYCLRTPPFKHSFQQIIRKFYRTITCAGN